MIYFEDLEVGSERVVGRPVRQESVRRAGQITKGIQCVKAVCGDSGGATAIGGKIYTTVTRPRTIGLRIGRKF